MNLAPTEIERLTMFMAAEHARRLRVHGIKLSHPEAIALIADEMMLAARKGMTYEAIVNFAGQLLTADDVEPGVPPMVDMISVEANFTEGTKMVIVFNPIGPGTEPAPEIDEPGEIITLDGEIELNAGRPLTVIDVVNTGDRDIQVRSHTHFFEVNPALDFDRAQAFGKRLDVLSGGGVRFEPGLRKRVTLIPMAGDRIVMGQSGLTQGKLDDDAVREAAFTAARAGGYRGI
ncbi:urease subunit beta [Acidisoma cellulosilytica]|uniref:urease n=1 Tax=Acidisoma cellulosilyticum TaxID=2802395 RepID=A0A963Z1X5_9PROT|nr:urease subunit beta [Acidisoma cellulosilyticum]MCB8881209.1 urease subunit beta [Acidisoma cellulosilyticum]